MAATSLSNVAHSAPTVRFAPLYPNPRPTRTTILFSPSLSSSSLLSALNPIPIVAKSIPPRCSKRSPRATISLGDKLPEAKLTHYDRCVLRTLRLSDVAFTRRVFIRVVPVDCATDTAFNIGPLLKSAEELKATTYDAIVAVAVNGAWAPQQSLDAGDNVIMLADEKGEFVKAMGFPPDLKDNEKVPFDVVMEVEDGFVNFLRYGRDYENFVQWKTS